MELTIKEIPAAFKANIPQGMRLFTKHEKEVLLVESIFCPNGHNLLVDSVRIHDEPSIRLNIKLGNQNGVVFLDSFWGSHANLFSFLPTQIKANSAVEAHCPYCDILLNVKRPCENVDCDSQEQIALYLPGRNNRIYVCPKVACPHHMLVVEDIPHDILEAIDEINYFGTGQDEVFGGI
ncbi:hypothetical protein [Marispirochaeta sp.]|jgi:hypothetical protein|uniref:hypothetical protein n=1 Tax=Marispirochaeta sp. TaxID=2038653 RepID=UPI0029C941DA|nr:hypothetical protein [Marispirochaeta sp.]